MTFAAPHKRLNWRTFWCCFFLSLGSFCYGYAASIISTTLGQPTFLSYMHLIDAQGNPAPNQAALTGTTVGLFCTGGCIGVLAASWSLDRIGRRPTMIVLVAIYILGTILVTASQNIGMFIVARTILGFGAVPFIAATSTYIAELSQAETRGFFTGLTGVAIAIGYTTAALMGLAFSYTTNPDVQWRTPLGLSLVPSTALLAVLFWAPESPRYLLLKGRVEEAWQTVSRLHHDPQDENQEYIKEEFFQMRTQLEFDRTLDSSWFHLFSKPSYRKRMLMASLVTFLGQSTAVLVAAAYGPSLYASLGFNVKQSLILQCGWIAGSIPAALIGVTLCDRFGRKPFIMAGYVGCVVSLVILTAMEAVYAPTATNKVGLGWAVTALYLIVIFYCLGVEACGAPFYCEIFPTHIRAKGVCFCVFVNSAANLLYLEVAPTALQNIGWRFLLVFICVLSVGSVLYWFWVPETRSVPLEELAAIFGDTDEVKIYSTDITVMGDGQIAIEEHLGKRQGADVKVAAAKKGTEVVLHEKV
ncbi:hypothetical protein AYO21_07802 [Fonsecaea monophora]|uniref:Major facilitator superfamily (MFS) profile domain-containing protein n=1 Tax=Fonsecaea monophora TaxID=254056 RepID=A0A177F3S3_9EURO|nr:hypothetical protein AYO21_07802 [Fonsecaea monophora]OAG37952.1 hypothetical protein AYO21_07802 [Fonsecaea monophora]